MMQQKHPVSTFFRHQLVASLAIASLALPTAAGAQELYFSKEGHAHDHSDDPLLGKWMVERLEWQKSTNSQDHARYLYWDMEGWIGYDLNKLWIKTEGQRADGKIEDAELQLLYDRAILPFWDAQIGIRHDVNPTPARNWLALGVQGLMPYFIDTQLTLFLGENGQSSFRATFTQEHLLTQKWEFTPKLELNFFGKDDPERGIGKGLADAELSLMLSYGFTRQFGLYGGVTRLQSFGSSKTYRQEEGEHPNSTRLIAGVKGWF